MKTRILISDLPKKIGQIVELYGFVHKIRDQKHVQFLVFKDISGLVQLVNEKKEGDEASSIISALTPESALKISGKVVENQKVKLGGIEILLNSLEVVNLAEAVPISEESSLEKQMDYRWVSLRQPRNRLIFQVQTCMEMAMRKFWDQNGFIEIHSPKLMGTASESGAELFKVEYFGSEAYLAQSPQFYKQMAMAAGLDRIFEIGPVFRANPSFTSRHDTEFTSIDMEISWIESYEELMQLEEEWLAFVIKEVHNKYSEEILREFGVEVKVPTTPFPRITLTEGRKVLEKMGHTIDHKADLDPQGERMLAEYIKKEFGHEFVFVTEYPTAVRAFYHMRPVENPSVTNSFDLLWKGLEITTGAQREHRPDILSTQAEEKGLSLGPLENYINFFRHGCPPHGGFGVGLTRMLMMLLGISNVREVTYLYRGPNRLTP